MIATMQNRDRHLVTGLLAAMTAVTGACATPPPSSGLEAVVQAARADAAHRTGVAPAELQLLGAEIVTWSDGSLGCPQPGMMYTQALVPGYRVRLRGPGGEMDYHASARGALVLCPPGRATPPVQGEAGK
jgi:hypothetical protein